MIKSSTLQLKIEPIPLDNNAIGNNDQMGSPTKDFLNFFDASIHVEKNKLLHVKDESVGVKCTDDFDVPVGSTSSNIIEQSGKSLLSSRIVADETKRTSMISMDDGEQCKVNVNKNEGMNNGW